MVNFNYTKIRHINNISYIIISITLIVLIVLCATGYSFKHVYNYTTPPEHFFSSIKKWISGDDDTVLPSNTHMVTPPMVIPPMVEIQPEESNIIDTTTLLNNLPPVINDKQQVKLPQVKLPQVELPQMNLQFFDSSDIPDEKQYMYTGAEIGLSGANVSCGKSTTTAVKATGIAILDRDGSISDIKVLNNGKGYKLPPIVTITGGGGSGCKAKAVIDDDTTVVHFEILDGGNGYISTPIIELEEPSNNKLCKLYIKTSNG